jgi:hypothetical protein
VQHEADGHDLNDLTRLGARQRGLEHGLVLLGIEPVANGRVDWRHAMLGEHVGQFAQCEFDPIDQSGGLIAGVIIGRVERPLEIVVNRQKVARQFGAAVLFGLAAIPLGALAGVFGISKGAHEAVTQIVPLGAEGLKFIGGDEVF